MNLLINYLHEAEPEFLAACIKRVMQFDPSPESDLTHVITCASRSDKGWIEYALKLRYRDYDGHIFVGAIQRTPGAEIEFHS